MEDRIAIAFGATVMLGCSAIMGIAVAVTDPPMMSESHSHTDFKSATLAKLGVAGVYLADPALFDANVPSAKPEPGTRF